MEEEKRSTTTAFSGDDSCSCGSDELLHDDEPDRRAGTDDDDRYCSANSGLGTPSSLGNDFFPYLLPSDGRAAPIDGEHPAATAAGGPEEACPLVMASSVAFGCDDWDEFMRESDTGGDCGDLAPLYLYDDHPAWNQCPPHAAANGESVAHQRVDPSLRHGGMDSNGEITQQQQQVASGGTDASDELGQKRVLTADPCHRHGGTDADDETTEQREVTADLPQRNGGIDASDEYTQQAVVTADPSRRSGGRGASDELTPQAVVAADPSQWSGGPNAKNEPAVLAEEEELTGNVVPPNAGEGHVCSKNTLVKSAPLSVGSLPADALQGTELRSRELEQMNPIVLSGQPHPDAGLHDHAGALDDGASPVEVYKLDVTDSFDDMVLEMEDILLNSGEPHGTRFPADSRKSAAQQSHHLRDGSSTASTSGTDDAYPFLQCSSKIDWVEVVGAKQRTGDVSFGERMVGVKEYTVYLLRVQSGKDEWEIERRYRDFFALYRQLKTLFTENGLSLPSPWLNVEREASKIFGNASPNVVSERSDLIQDCLRSVLVCSHPFGTPGPLVSFLSPGKPAHKYSFLKTVIPQSLQKFSDDLRSKDSDYNGTCHEETISMGKTISLVVEIRPRKSTRQLLELQHYSCAGCRRRLDAGRTLLQELAQTIGWNKPRFCAYTGQLFCASCHTNDSAVLPARVLHFWDFSLYPVSQLAKAYLESIYDQPMLCVSAVNPFLFSKVPALLHVMNIRKKLAAMLPYIRCPFRSSIEKGLGVRRYLLESNDFFALHDLVDLSKGAFAALPVMVQTISNRILEHITQQCLVCYDVGVPCAARQACDDQLSLIFPFQEAEAIKCGSCGSVFHKLCFEKLDVCPCGKATSTGRRIAPLEQARNGAEGLLGESVQPPVFSSSSGFFSDILSKARPDKIWKPRNSNPVILMGSLPNTSM